jgi:hypothetical protein
MATTRQQTKPDGSFAMSGDQANPEEDNFLTDMFAGQDVDGPAQGAWGAQGTQAAAVAAQQNAKGAAAANQATGIQNQAGVVGQQAAAVGQSAGQVGSSNSINALDAAAAAGQRATPQANWQPTQQTQAGTQQTLDALNRFAGGQGNGPSAAQAVANRTQSQGVGQALALARSGRGFGGNAAAAGQAQGTIAGINANATAQGAQIAASEDAAAKQRQLAALNASLGGGLGLAQQQAGQSQFDVSSALQSRGINDAAAQANNQNALNWANYGTGAQQNASNIQLGGIGAQTAAFGAGQQSQLGHETLGQNAYNSQADYELQQQQMELEAQKANQATDTERDAANSSTASMLTLGLLSDERQKKLKRKESALAASLGALETLGDAPASSYEYKDPSLPGASPGRHVSSMAQDLERGPRGGEIVHETPNGKVVDYAAVMKMTPGAITELNRKVAALEKALGGRAA